MLWVALAVLAILPFGYLAAQSLRKKKTRENKEDGSKCFDIKKLLDAKLKELTDLKGRVKSEAKNKAKETIREAVDGTSAGEALGLIEKAEKEYGRLKKLYEECMVEFGVNKRVIIVHGGPLNTLESDPHELHTYWWFPWVKAELERRGIETIVPPMPHPWNPIYAEYKKEFEKLFVDENTIVIGHSRGCAFLVRWLGETKRHVQKLIMVAPSFIPSGNNEFKKAFYAFDIDATIKERVKRRVIFTSDTEGVEGKRSASIINEKLNCEVISLKNHGHYISEEMGGNTFPELIECVLAG